MTKNAKINPDVLLANLLVAVHGGRKKAYIDALEALVDHYARTGAMPVTRLVRSVAASTIGNAIENEHDHLARHAVFSAVGSLRSGQSLCLIGRQS